VLLRSHSNTARLVSETKRMLVAQLVADQTALFRVPRILDVDEFRLTLHLEYVNGLRPISSLNARQLKEGHYFERIGEILRCIHASRWEGEAGQVQPLFHGDFDLRNLCIDPIDVIYVTDWDQAPGLDRLYLDPVAKDVGLLQFSSVATLLQKAMPANGIRALCNQMIAHYAPDTGEDERMRLLRLGRDVSIELARLENIPRVSIAKRIKYWTIRQLAKQIIVRALTGSRNL